MGLPVKLEAVEFHLHLEKSYTENAPVNILVIVTQERLKLQI